MKLSNKEKLKIALKDPTSYSLLIPNIVIIAVSIYEKISFENLLFVFYFQSLIIGFFVLIKILNYKGDVEEFKDISSPKHYKNIALASFFAFKFGFFHFVYLFFIGFPSIETFKIIIPYCLMFFINHLFSYIYFINRKVTLNIKKIDSIIIRRVFPLHAFIIFGSILIGLISVILSELNIDQTTQSLIINGSAITFLLALKTVVDINAHINQHSEF